MRDVFSLSEPPEGFGEAALAPHIEQGVAVHCNAGFQRSIPFLAFPPARATTFLWPTRLRRSARAQM
jgi:hypothetical protein